MKEIITVIVDDEQKSVTSLRKLLEQYCPQVNVAGIAHNVKDAVKTIKEKEPELVFLDISLPDGEGFDVIDSIEDKKFEVIFTTAHNQYAVKAFEMSALHYLLKPIDDKELVNAVERFELHRELGYTNNEERFNVFKDTLFNKPEKIILPTIEGFSIINIDEIIRCEADNNYTLFFLTNNRQIMVSKTLSVFEKILSDLNFSRVHSKHLVNLIYVKQYIRGRGGYLLLKDDTHINVAEARKGDFIQKLKNIARSI